MTQQAPTSGRAAQLTQLERIVTALLQDGRHDEAFVLEQLNLYRPIAGPELTDPDVEFIARRMAERLNIDVDRGTVIIGADYEPWLQDRRRNIDWGRWIAYKQLLFAQTRAPKVIDALDGLTDEILDLVGDPSLPGTWARRGLVLGDVQSGKTGTYLGLFNKAADAGYRLVILLAGNTEVLRQQTQARVDEAFIGRDSTRQIPRKGTDATPKRFIGVGEFRKDLAQGIGMTTVIRDFRRSSYEASNITIQTDANHPYVFVLKKNKSILNAVIQWLSEQAGTSGGTIKVPVLVLDDESDYASINTKDETDPTAINKAIRDILALFSRSSYVAFTATPFANIFIDHGIENDLFPRDFVYSLEAPSNYVGSSRVFGTSDDVRDSSLTYIEDAEESIPIKHRSQDTVPFLPESLVEAVRCFFLANAIRDLRGHHDAPRSMLVNVSRYKHVQGQVLDLMAERVSALRNAIELHGASETHPELQELQAAYVRHFGDITETWDKIIEVLPASIADVRVMIFNSDKDRKLAQEDLAWDRSPRMIAVGGDVLSRGLTLEGLLTSYFYRSVTASDTLMQMARWFGFRDGYEDLCRLWINAESAASYRFAAESVEDLRTDLRLMLRQRLTPADFGLAVRKHPNALLITARNKMKSAQSVSRVISLAGRRLETTTLDVSRNRHAGVLNLRALESLLMKVEDDATFEPTARGWLRWRGVDRGLVADLLENYRAVESDPFFFGTTLSSWTRRAKAERFSTWDIVIARGMAGSKRMSFAGHPDYPIPQRTLEDRGKTARIGGGSLRLAGSSDMSDLVDQVTAAEVNAAYKAAHDGKPAPEREFYTHLVRPCLIAYVLDGGAKHDLLALKVAIPGDTTDVHNHDGEIEYIINTVAQEQWLTEFTGADDEDVDD